MVFIDLSKGWHWHLGFIICNLVFMLVIIYRAQTTLKLIFFYIAVDLKIEMKDQPTILE